MAGNSDLRSSYGRRLTPGNSGTSLRECAGKGCDGQIDSRPQNFGEVQKRRMSGLTPKDGKSTTGCPLDLSREQQIGGDLV